jgi:hypothetical protein
VPRPVVIETLICADEICGSSIVIVSDLDDVVPDDDVDINLP